MHAVVAAAALGDVVQQHRDVERPARRDLAEQRGRQRMVLGELAALDRRQQPDRPDRMLVDRIMVVHVELHLRDDAAEVGNEAAEHAGLVHPAQHQLGRVDVGQHLHEQARWRAGRRAPWRRSAWHRGSRRASRWGGFRAARARPARTARAGAPDRSAKKSSRRDRQPAAVEGEAVEALGPAADRRQREAEALLAQLLVELGEEQAGQVADRLGVEEVELHEALDRRFPRPVGVMHDLGDVPLMVEAQPLLGAAGERGAGGSAPPRRSARRARSGGTRRRSAGPAPTRSDGPLDAVDIFADPVERVEVAKAALAVLDVGLDDVAAVAHPDVALRRARRAWRRRIRPRCRRRPPCGSGASRRRTAARRPTASRASRNAVRTVMSFFGERDQLADRAQRMADLELQVPQQVEHRLGARSSSRATACPAVRNIRSRSLNGAISPRPVPPRPTTAPVGRRRRRRR